MTNNLTNHRFVNFRTGQITTRKSRSRWEYTRSHTSSKSADVIVWLVSERGQMNTAAKQSSFLASKDTPDAEVAWSGGRWTLTDKQDRFSMHVVGQHDQVFFFFFFTASIKLKGELSELSFFFAHLSGLFQYYICERSYEKTQSCWTCTWTDLAFSKYIIKSNISWLDTTSGEWPRRISERALTLSTFQHTRLTCSEIAVKVQFWSKDCLRCLSLLCDVTNSKGKGTQGTVQSRKQQTRKGAFTWKIYVQVPIKRQSNTDHQWRLFLRESVLSIHLALINTRCK